MCSSKAIKDSTVELKIVVGDKMPAVIGKGGSVIKKIQGESGASLSRVLNEEALVLSGFAENVAVAKV
jgi:hypothetical protein